MNVDFQKINFLAETDNLSYQNLEDKKKVYFNICLYSEKFKEYQKNLFNNFYSQILDLLDNSGSYLDFKKEVESEIKQFNIQLKIFEEKINVEEKITIRWTVQIIYWENYLSALIWESSLLIFRQEKLESVIVNEIEGKDRIDVFGEIIEWELENQDEILSICTDIYNYMSDDEIKEIISIEDSAQALKEILTTKVEDSEIGSIEQINIKIERIQVEKIKQMNFEKYIQILRKNKYPIWIVIWLIIVFFIIFSIFSRWQNTPRKFTLPDWQQRTASIDKLKRKIDWFWKLEDADTSVKKQTYDEIMAELDMYQKNNIQTLEIKELRKKVEQNYYRWFNINLIWKDDGVLNKIYSIDEKTIQNLSWFVNIFESRSKINLAWTKAVLLDGINDKHKWTLQKINIPTKLKVCTENLTNNGLYCAMENWDIYNISKYWINTLTNNSKKWPKNIIWIWTYWRNKIYILTNDTELNAKWIFIVRYVLKTKNDFWAWTSYVFSKNVAENLKNSIYSWSTMSVDWTFLLWGKEWIMQAFRESSTNNALSLRSIKWRDKAIIENWKDFSWDVKIISNIWSNYIHAYDKNTSSITTYLTSPYKTNSSYTNSYQLIYKFKTKFRLNDEIIKDINVNYNSTTKDKVAIILTDKSVYKISLNQFER